MGYNTLTHTCPHARVILFACLELQGLMQNTIMRRSAPIFFCTRSTEDVKPGVSSEPAGIFLPEHKYTGSFDRHYNAVRIVTKLRIYTHTYRYIASYSHNHKRYVTFHTSESTYNEEAVAADERYANTLRARTVVRVSHSGVDYQYRKALEELLTTRESIILPTYRLLVYT